MSGTPERQTGFTIVELLIVIVVIAILAAISIVAYSGIQARAKYTQQVAEVDRVGKAIQLWVAENGGSLGQSGSGYNGTGVGWFDGDSGSYPSPSLEDMLRSDGYLSGPLDVNGRYMLTPCTSYSNPRWIVLTTLDPAPPTSVSDQTSQSGCTSSLLTQYTDLYGKNFIKVY